ncbi:MAG: MATE family efflux transporter [Firmicutes bacterium]|jgi:MATE family multidrug resistance protein|nr:MATE family efflux transporter [Bacillota bacterium]
MGQHDTSHPRPLWLSRPIHSELIRLTIPTIISTLAVPLLGIVDTAVLGRLPDVRQLAGATSACVILSIVFQMFFFLRMGTTALVAQRWGADDRRGAAMVLFQSLAIAAVLGLGLIVLRRPIALIGFALVGAPEDVTALGEAYFAVRIFEAPFYLMTLALTALMRGQGDALVPMYIVLGVNTVNIAGDLLLVPGTFGLPSYGVVGAAWASLAAQATGWAIAVLVGWKRVRAYWDWGWLRAWRRLPWHRFFTVSRHLFIRTLTLVLTLASVTSRVARLESAPILAAHAILMQLWSLVSHGVDGFAYATETMVGAWLGRGDRERAHASGVAALLWGVGVGTLFGIAYFVGVDKVATFFTTNKEVADIVISLVWAVALSQPVNAIAYVFDGVLIGATDTHFLQNAMLTSAAVFAGTLGVGWLASGLSLQLIWWALLLFTATRAVTLGIRFRSGHWYRLDLETEHT